MAYKPVSQIVSDNKDAEIPSSDAINDRIVAEIAAIPASASLTLDNLTAPTAVNQNLILDATKVLSTNGRVLPTFTQSGNIQNDIFLKNGSVVSEIQANALAKTHILSNAYVDNSVYKRGAHSTSGSNVWALRYTLDATGGIFGQQGAFYWDFTTNAAADTDITWTTGASLIFGYNNATFSCNNIRTNTLQLASGDNTGNLGGSYYTSRYAILGIGTRASIGAVKLNSGTGACSPAGVLSSYGKSTVSSLGRTGTGAAITQISAYDGNSGGVFGIGVGDYVQAAGLPTISRISSIDYSPLTAVLNFETPIGGDGIDRNVIAHRPAFVAFSHTGNQTFTVRHDDYIDMRATVAINNYRIDPHVATASTNIDWQTGTTYELNLTAPVTLTFANPVEGASYIIKIAQDNVGGHTVTWPAGMKWSGGAPSLTGSPDSIDMVTMLYMNGIYYAAFAPDFL